MQEIRLLPPPSASSLFVAGNRYQEAAELAFHLPDHPHTLAFNIGDLWVMGAVLVWTQSDPHQVPAAFAAVAPGAEPGAPFDLPMRRGDGTVHVGWAILKPR